MNKKYSSIFKLSFLYVANTIDELREHPVVKNLQSISSKYPALTQLGLESPESYRSLNVVNRNLLKLELFKDQTPKKNDSNQE